MTRPDAILFCSDFPLGYHNPEAERTLAGFAARGYRATYVEKLGIRNPGPAHLAQVLRRLRTEQEPAGGFARDPASAVSHCSPKLLPPRHVPPVDAFNRRWLARQLGGHVRDPAATILWIRYATPELVPFAERPEWPLVVFEAVDDHLASPGLPRRHRDRLARAQERILRRAGLVFAWSPAIAERLREQHGHVVVTGAAADLDAFAAARAATAPAARVAAYAGSLDGRFDGELLAAAAAALPHWTFRVAGPADDDAARPLDPLGNVELIGRIAPEAVPGVLAGASVCLAPYRQDDFNETLFPLKLVEGLATGRPVVSTPIRPARELADVIELAGTPAEFAAAIETAGENPSAGAERRLQRVAPYGWDARIGAMHAAVEEALG